MTITNRELNGRLQNLQACYEYAPERTYDDAKRGYEAVNDAIEMVRSIFKEYGFKALGDDRCRNLEVTIYGFLLESNPEAYGLITGEGFGASCTHSKTRREWAIDSATRNRDAFEAVRGRHV